MEEEPSLAQLRAGQQGQVQGCATTSSMRRRLQDLGMVPGAFVECVGISPLGDPAAYRVRGAVIALRRRDAQAVLLY